MNETDWARWHEKYDRPGSGLADRLAAVRQAIDRHLSRSAPDPVRVVSACAGDGRDLLGVLAERTDAHRVSGLLVESDPGLAARALEAARLVSADIEVRHDDAARSDTYVGSVPADLVLLCGIFGNISDADVRATVIAAPQLCAAGAEVVWTRHRAEPDLTPSIRRWFEETGYEEVDFATSEDLSDSWAVGVHRLIRDPEPLVADQHWFSFLR